MNDKMNDNIVPRTIPSLGYVSYMDKVYITMFVNGNSNIMPVAWAKYLFWFIARIIIADINIAKKVDLIPTK